MSQSTITLIASHASDLDVVNAARVSYDTFHEEFEDGDDKLIFYLVRNQHGTPFEHTFFKFRIEAPIFVFREWHRHRIGHSYNEMSGRYVELAERFYDPPADQIRKQDGKPGHYRYATADEDIGSYAADLIHNSCEQAFEDYRGLLAVGVAKEQARCVLPVGTFSQMIWSCNARSLMAFLELRTHERAQKEIRDIALVAEEIFAELMPVTHQAFVDAGEEVSVTDQINHPAYYGGADNPYEAIKVIEAWDLDFALGNAVKYISRAGKKAPATEVVDLKKARWYLDRRITNIEEGAA